MDSPQLQSTHSLHRMRTNSNLTVHSPVNNRGAIQKRTLDNARNRSVSTSHAERLHQLALDQSHQGDTVIPTSIAPHWITPDHSPQSQPIFTEQPVVDHYPQWTVPTPPRSDSGVPTVSVDANEVPVTSGITSTQDFNFEQPTASAEMRFVPQSVIPPCHAC